MNLNIQKLLIFIFIQLLSTQILAQVFTLSGVLKNESTDESIPFANVWITGYAYGTSTNDEGVFEIKLDSTFFSKDYSLSFSCIGYELKEVPIRNLLSEIQSTIGLSPSTTNLSEVIVLSERLKKRRANQAEKLVSKALSKIPKNYPKAPHLLNTFYRHYCSENDEYVRLIEAAIDIYKPKNNGGYKLLPEDKLAFKVTQLRRSFDFTKNSKIYHPHISLNFLISNDITSYLYHNPFGTDLKPYSFIIEDTTMYENNRVFVVRFQEKNMHARSNVPKYSGKLYILDNSLAFLRIEINEIRRKSNLRDSVNSAIKKIIAFKPYENKFYMDRVSSDVMVYRTTKDSSGSILDELKHSSHVELIANKVISDNPKEFMGKEPNKGHLQMINYDSVFWKNYTVLKETTLESKIIEDLSKKLSLETQFNAFNTVESGGTSIIESSKFQSLISKLKGKPSYIVLWSEPGDLNFLDIKPAPYMRRKIRKSQMHFILVNINQSEGDWISNRKFFGLNNSSITHRRMDFGFDSELTSQYFNNIFPYYLIVDKESQILDGSPPLPGSDEIKVFLKPYFKRKLKSN